MKKKEKYDSKDYWNKRKNLMYQRNLFRNLSCRNPKLTGINKEEERHPNQNEANLKQLIQIMDKEKEIFRKITPLKKETADENKSNNENYIHETRTHKKEETTQS